MLKKLIPFDSMTKQKCLKCVIQEKIEIFRSRSIKTFQLMCRK